MSFEHDNLTEIVEDNTKINFKKLLEITKSKLSIMLVSLATAFSIFFGLYKNKTNSRKMIQFL